MSATAADSDDGSPALCEVQGHTPTHTPTGPTLFPSPMLRDLDSSEFSDDYEFEPYDPDQHDFKAQLRVPPSKHRFSGARRGRSPTRVGGPSDPTSPPFKHRRRTHSVVKRAPRRPRIAHIHSPSGWRAAAALEYLRLERAKIDLDTERARLACTQARLDLGLLRDRDSSQTNGDDMEDRDYVSELASSVGTRPGTGTAAGINIEVSEGGGYHHRERNRIATLEVRLRAANDRECELLKSLEGALQSASDDTETFRAMMARLDGALRASHLLCADEAENAATFRSTLAQLKNSHAEALADLAEADREQHKLKMEVLELRADLDATNALASRVEAELADQNGAKALLGQQLEQSRTTLSLLQQVQVGHQEELTAERASRAKAELRAQHLEEDMCRREECLTARDEEITRLRDALSVTTAELLDTSSELRSVVGELEEEIELLRCGLSTRTNHAMSLEDELEQIRLSRSETSDRALELEDECATLQVELGRREAEVDTLQEMVDGMVENLWRLRADLRSTQLELQDVIATNDEEMDTKQAEIYTLQEALTATSGEVAQIQEELWYATSTLEEEMCNKDVQIELLQDGLDVARADLVDATGELRRTIAVLSCEVMTKDEQLAKAQNALGASRSELVSLTADLRRALESLESEMTAKDAQLSVLRGVLQTTQVEVAESTRELQAATASLACEVAARDAQIGALTLNLAAARAELDAATVEFDTNTTNLQDSVLALDNELQVKTHEALLLGQALNAARLELKDTTSELRSAAFNLEAQMAASKGALLLRDGQIATLRGNVLEVTGELADLKRDVAATIVVLEKEMADRDQEVADRDSALADKEQELADKQAEVARSKEAVATAAADVTALRESLHRMTAELLDTTAKLNTAHQEAATQVHSARRLSVRFDAQMIELSLERSALTSLRRVHEVASKDLTSTKTALGQAIDALRISRADTAAQTREAEARGAALDIARAQGADATARVVLLESQLEEGAARNEAVQAQLKRAQAVVTAREDSVKLLRTQAVVNREALETALAQVEAQTALAAELGARIAGLEKDRDDLAELVMKQTITRRRSLTACSALALDLGIDTSPVSAPTTNLTTSPQPADPDELPPRRATPRNPSSDVGSEVASLRAQLSRLVRSTSDSLMAGHHAGPPALVELELERRLDHITDKVYELEDECHSYMDELHAAHCTVERARKDLKKLRRGSSPT